MRWSSEVSQHGEGRRHTQFLEYHGAIINPNLTPPKAEVGPSAAQCCACAACAPRGAPCARPRRRSAHRRRGAPRCGCARVCASRCSGGTCRGCRRGTRGGGPRGARGEEPLRRPDKRAATPAGNRTARQRTRRDICKVSTHQMRKITQSNVF